MLNGVIFENLKLNIFKLTFNLQLSSNFQKRTQTTLLHFNRTHVHVLAQALHLV